MCISFKRHRYLSTIWSASGVFTAAKSSSIWYRGKVLRLQPELKKAIASEQVALCPPNALARKLAELQDRNIKQPISARQMFTSVSPFQLYEYRIVPLLEGVTLYAAIPPPAVSSNIRLFPLVHMHSQFCLCALIRERRSFRRHQV
ncbi:hypothetical protein CPB85DRAFT_205552 [Mucidula mucida]|nr:hypothetical protein CPB85DRAFT_205552 [Mucidula mucida]